MSARRPDRRRLLAGAATGFAGTLLRPPVLRAAPSRPTPWPALERQLGQIAASSDGVLGVAVIHPGSGRQASHNGDRRFYMASVYKLPIALTVLEAVDAGRLQRAEVEPLLAAMVGKSENPATDKLLDKVGGPAAVMAWLGRNGLKGIRVDRYTRDLRTPPQPPGAPPDGADQRDTCTPNAMAALLLALAQGRVLGADSRAQLLRIMGAPDVVGPKRLPGLLPAGTFVAHKTGTNPQRVVNDVGLVRLPAGGELVIAAFLADSSRPMDARERVLAELGRAAYDHALRGPK